MEGGGGESESTALEYTPTWIVAAVCSLIVVISLAAERCLHHLGKVTAIGVSLRFSNLST
jgi:mlo protein